MPEITYRPDSQINAEPAGIHIVRRTISCRFLIRRQSDELAGACREILCAAGTTVPCRNYCAPQELRLSALTRLSV